MVAEKLLLTEDKAVIVSQWPSMLLLIEKQLSQYKVKTGMFSGSVPVPQRNKLIEDFNSSKDPKVNKTVVICNIKVLNNFMCITYKY